MRALMLFVIGLTFGAAGGFVVAAGNAITFDGHKHTNASQHTGSGHAAMGHSMSHDEPFEVSAASAPTLDIIIAEDLMTGFNLRVKANGFAFAPKSASLAHVEGEGHAHVYVNGVKFGRLYGEWMHLDALPKGEVEIEVSLNTNDHRPLAVDGAVIMAKKVVMVK